MSPLTHWNRGLVLFVGIIGIAIIGGCGLIDPPPDRSLHEDVMEGDVEQVEAHIRHESDLDEQDNLGRTALYLATERGQAEIVSLLLDAGADAALSGSNQRTPLHAAARSGHAAIVRELVQHVEDLDVADTVGLTALDAAAAEGHAEVLAELLGAGASLSVDRGNVPLTELLAADSGIADSVDQLASVRLSATADQLDELLVVADDAPPDLNSSPEALAESERQLERAIEELTGLHSLRLQTRLLRLQAFFQEQADEPQLVEQIERIRVEISQSQLDEELLDRLASLEERFHGTQADRHARGIADEVNAAVQHVGYLGEARPSQLIYGSISRLQSVLSELPPSDEVMLVPGDENLSLLAEQYKHVQAEMAEAEERLDEALRKATQLGDQLPEIAGAAEQSSWLADTASRAHDEVQASIGRLHDRQQVYDVLSEWNSLANDAGSLLRDVQEWKKLGPFADHAVRGRADMADALEEAAPAVAAYEAAATGMMEKIVLVRENLQMFQTTTSKPSTFDTTISDILKELEVSMASLAEPDFSAWSEAARHHEELLEHVPPENSGLDAIYELLGRLREAYEDAPEHWSAEPILELWAEYFESLAVADAVDDADFIPGRLSACCWRSNNSPWASNNSRFRANERRP